MAGHLSSLAPGLVELISARHDQKDTNATGRERFRLVCERNAFAHAPSPVRFSTPEIEEACALLKVPARVGAADVWDMPWVSSAKRQRKVWISLGCA
jgi:hypothetical protein